MKKAKLFLVGNAHLDPVWQWRWQEGSAEAKATIRSALDRMKEFPDFRFVCSSASVYQWVEEFAPQMFQELKQRVQEGRFVVVGGWHTQPDCNLPSGEGFARQSLYAQRYFKEILGVTAKVGYNVDSFGHNWMLPQILKKSGMDSYLFMRPGAHEKTMPSELFVWQSPDGSQVTAFRIMDSYCTSYSKMEDLEERLNHLEEIAQSPLEGMPLMYGVGNHGGGPTIKNLELFTQFQKENPQYELIYSNVEDFFRWVKESGAELPVHNDDLQHHASGCYSTVFHVKEGIRRAECNLIAAESFGVMAHRLCGKVTRQDLFQDAWKQVCFLHFHDSMGGCSARFVHEEGRRMYGYAQQIADEQENNALQTISWAIDTSDRSKGIPFVVFNPHSFPVRGLLQVNTYCQGVLDEDGNTVCMQLVRSETQECTKRKDSLFPVEIPAMGYRIYYLNNPTRALPLEPEQPATSHNSPVRVTPRESLKIAHTCGGPVLENEYLRVEFEDYSGYILSITHKETGRNWLRDKGAVPVVIDEYYHDAWSHAKNYFTDIMGRFSDATVSITESGPLRATVKVVSCYNHSTLTQWFTLEAGSPKLHVQAEVNWQEQHKMLKLAWPMDVENPQAYYEIPFGVIQRPADGEEEPGLNWVAVKGENGGFALVNDATYSSCVRDNVLYHTVIRSPIYGDHGGIRDEESPFMNLGNHRFAYTLMETAETWASVVQEGKLLNTPLRYIMENWHEGIITQHSMEGLRVCPENVMLSACKRSEDNTGYILRLYELDGRQTQVQVSGQLLPVPLCKQMGPYSISTFYLKDGAKDWEEVMLTEYPEDCK